MIINIRRLSSSSNEYFAYANTLSGKGAYFLYFTDDIFGAVSLCNFTHMLKNYFKQDKIELKVLEKNITLKNDYILQLLKEY
jgi:hypothetical protein